VKVLRKRLRKEVEHCAVHEEKLFSAASGAFRNGGPRPAVCDRLRHHGLEILPGLRWQIGLLCHPMPEIPSTLEMPLLVMGGPVFCRIHTIISSGMGTSGMANLLTRHQLERSGHGPSFETQVSAHHR
jgi:hypothetical protein